MKKTATLNSWNYHPADQPKRIEVNWHFSREQFISMKRDYVPEEMEEKWFPYYRNDRLYSHRSGTGCGICADNNVILTLLNGTIDPLGGTSIMV